MGVQGDRSSCGPFCDDAAAPTNPLCLPLGPYLPAPHAAAPTSADRDETARLIAGMGAAGGAVEAAVAVGLPQALPALFVADAALWGPMRSGEHAGAAGSSVTGPVPQRAAARAAPLPPVRASSSTCPTCRHTLPQSGCKAWWPCSAAV